MTIVAIWERRVPPLAELIVASDSRLSGGEVWDGCPKVFSVPGFPLVFAFAGNTHLAYPFILQALAQTQSFDANRRGEADVRRFAFHLARTLDQMRSQLGRHTAHRSEECELAVAGWSWRSGLFRAFRVAYNVGARQFTSERARPAPESLGGRDASRTLLVLGDRTAKSKFSHILATRQELGALSYEPLDAIRSLSRSELITSVGGPLQVVKAYQNMRVEPLCVAEGEHRYLAGRQLLDSESIDLRTLRNTGSGWKIEAGDLTTSRSDIST